MRQDVVETLLPAFVAASPAIAYLASFWLDKKTIVTDSSYHLVTSIDGKAFRNVQILSVAILLVALMHVWFRAYSRRWSCLTLFAVPGLLIAGLEIVRGELKVNTLLGLILGCLLTLVAGGLSVSRESMRALGVWLMMFCALTWMTFVLKPSDAAKPCRDDKCSPLGVLVMGFMGHEQVLGLYVAFLLPALAFFASRQMITMTVFALLTVVGSGSRTSLICAGFGLVGLVVIRRTRTGKCVPLGVRTALAATPLMLLTVATSIFLFASSASLTERGDIFAFLRRYVHEHLVFGPGHHVLTTAYETSLISWPSPHAHNEAGDILLGAGVIGLTCLYAAFAFLCVRALTGSTWEFIAFALAPSFGFTTEPVWSFNFFSSHMWSLLVVVALYAQSRRPSSSSKWSTP